MTTSVSYRISDLRVDILTICLMTRNANSSYILWSVFIFSTMIAYGVYMATNISDCQYDIGVKSQIYLNFVYMARYANSNIYYGRCSHLAQ